MQKKVIVGLTGQSGAGKSTAARMFQDNRFYIVDADKVAREITSSTKTAEKLAELFGNSILYDDDTLNRKALANIVFSDSKKLQVMNELLFPIIIKEIKHKIEWAPNTYVLLDAPQLFESKLNEICDIVVSVVAPREILIQRICNRDKISQDLAEKRLASQLDELFFIDHSTYVIHSDGDYNHLRTRVDSIARDIKKEVDVFEF